jgi:hydrogenase expression/formation protein HypC
VCLGEIAQVKHLTGDGRALVDAEGRTRAVSLLTLDSPVAAGDWLLIHSGFALSRLSPEQAHESLAIRTATLEDSP